MRHLTALKDCRIGVRQNIWPEFILSWSPRQRCHSAICPTDSALSSLVLYNRYSWRTISWSFFPKRDLDAIDLGKFLFLLGRKLLVAIWQHRPELFFSVFASSASNERNQNYFRGNNFLARLDRVDRLRRSERRHRHRRRRRRHDRLVRPVPILLKRGKKQFSIKRSCSATQSKMADLQLFQARSFSVEMYSGYSGWVIK